MCSALTVLNEAAQNLQHLLEEETSDRGIYVNIYDIQRSDECVNGGKNEKDLSLCFSMREKLITRQALLLSLAGSLCVLHNSLQIRKTKRISLDHDISHRFYNK